MATNDNSKSTLSSETELNDEMTCCIEASVVSGFEECARGEAREKFNVDVKAARGKITWEIPISQVNEVIKMGSIDNCKVMMKSVPHFGFTDTHDSLARLQKLVAELDWEKGLYVWNRFNNFPHPISANPGLISSPEDLVEVIVVDLKARPQGAQGGKDKKGKKGGKGKRRDKKKKNAGEETAQQEGIEQKEESKNVSAEAADENISGAGQSFEKVLDDSFDENGRKTVIVKRLDPNEPPPDIKIKVLIPGPNESVFPTDVNDIAAREEQPMDIDTSMIQDSTDCKVLSPPKSQLASDTDNTPKDNETEESKPLDQSMLRSPTSPIKQPSSAIGILSSARDFASSVIERLSSSPKPTDTDLSLPACVTPPPTPVQAGLDYFMKSQANQNKTSTSVDESDSKENEPTYSVTEEKETSNFKCSKSPPSSSVDGEDNLCEQTEKICVDENVALPKTTAKASDESNEFPDNESSQISTNEKGKEIGTENKEGVKKERDPTKPTFRVTCNRQGDHHKFDSTSAAASFGSAINRFFDWSVDLKNFDIEVLLHIDNEEVTVGLGITKTSLHNRNLVAFGPTTLRATICYNMLRLCRIRKGDFICDPMCGTSAIPIEGSLNWVHSFFFSGEYHEKAISRSLENMEAVNKKLKEEKNTSLKMDTIQWNIENFPLRDKCVDVFVSDLPFGYRMGSRATNRSLYPTLLNAMARTARPGARACLLTEDRTSLIKSLQTMSRFWQRRLILSINVGGLSGFVFLLTRTTASFSCPTDFWRQDKSVSDDLQAGEVAHAADSTQNEEELSPIPDENKVEEVVVNAQNSTASSGGKDSLVQQPGSGVEDGVNGVIGTDKEERTADCDPQSQGDSALTNKCLGKESESESAVLSSAEAAVVNEKSEIQKVEGKEEVQ